MTDELIKKPSSLAGLVKKDGAGLAALKRDIVNPPMLNHQESVVLCLDVSTSMEPHVHALRTAARSFIGDCSPGMTHAGVISWSSDVVLHSPITPALGIAQGSCSRLESRGATIMGKGLQAAIEQLSAHRARVSRILLMTDGFVGDQGQPERVIEPVKSWVIVDCVAFGEHCDFALLERLAAMTGGVVKRAGDEKELVRQFKALEAKQRGLLGPVTP